jgi:hypothetical protein
MPRGGFRPGAGRKRGSLTRRTQAIAEAAAKSGLTPLEVMLLAIEKLLKKRQFTAAAEIAKDAAPYMHPRLSAVEQRIEGILREYAVSDEPLSADEWAAKYGGMGMAPAARPAKGAG